MAKAMRGGNGRTETSTMPPMGTPVIQAQGDEAPSLEAIARRAYELFLARGGEDGHDQDDWYQAERELRGGTH